MDCYSPFKDESTEGFVGPRRGAQSFLEKLDFLLQALQTNNQKQLTKVNTDLSGVLNSNMRVRVWAISYRDLFISTGQLHLHRLHVVFVLAQLQRDFVQLKRRLKKRNNNSNLEDKHSQIASSVVAEGRSSYLVVWGDHFSLQLLTHVVGRLKWSFQIIVLSLR